MSIDLLARQAGQRLAAASADVDTGRALDAVLARRAPRRTVARWPVAVACVASLLLAVWLVAPGAASLRRAPTDPVSPQAGVAVGSELPVGSSLRTPEGWHAIHDGGYVVLAPDHGDPRGVRIVVGVPTGRYDAVGHLHPLPPGSLLRWALHHPALRATDRRTVAVPGGTATTIQLHVRPGQRWRLANDQCVGLVQLRDDAGAETVSYTWGDGTNLWAVVTSNGTDLLVAGWSPLPSDDDLTNAFHSALQSLQLGAADHG